MKLIVSICELLLVGQCLFLIRLLLCGICVGAYDAAFWPLCVLESYHDRYINYTTMSTLNPNDVVVDSMISLDSVFIYLMEFQWNYEIIREIITLNYTYFGLSIQLFENI